MHKKKITGTSISVYSCAFLYWMLCEFEGDDELEWIALCIWRSNTCLKLSFMGSCLDQNESPCEFWWRNLQLPFEAPRDEVGRDPMFLILSWSYCCNSDCLLKNKKSIGPSVRMSQIRELQHHQLILWLQNIGFPLWLCNEVINVSPQLQHIVICSYAPSDNARSWFFW